MPDTTNVFTYGSLMFREVWQQVVRGDYRSSEATIHGFRRVRVRDGNHPALVISRHAAPVLGRVYFSVSAADIARLDYFETSKYARVSVAATVNGSALMAQAFLAINLDSLSTADWCRTEFEQTGLSVFLATYAVKNIPPG
jgi:gamma-glutamylcyclotransferase (GGCT)/AIG2-like uncharacterized protein YtfP